MTAPTHITIAIASSIFTANVLKINISPTEFLLLITGALFPDLDGGGVITRPGSILKRFLTRPFVLFLDFFGSIFSEVFRKFTGHRGLLHWLVWPTLLVLYGVKFSKPMIFWFGLGYLTHVIADALTPLGVPLFAPLSTKKINLMSIKTGSYLEFLVFGATLLYSFVFCWSLLPEGVQKTFKKLYENY